MLRSMPAVFEERDVVGVDVLATAVGVMQQSFWRADGAEARRGGPPGPSWRAVWERMPSQPYDGSRHQG